MVVSQRTRQFEEVQRESEQVAAALRKAISQLDGSSTKRERSDPEMGHLPYPVWQFVKLSVGTL